MKQYIIAIVAGLFVLASCQERNPDLFMDISGVYFNNTTGGMTVVDSLDVTFVYEAEDVVEVPVKVQLLGRIADEERPFGISVHSENAREGIDYELPLQAVLPAGESSVDYIVRLKRTPALKSEKKMLHLRISENEHFGLPVTEIVQVSDTVSVLDYRIYFSDMFTKAPSARVISDESLKSPGSTSSTLQMSSNLLWVNSPSRLASHADGALVNMSEKYMR